MDYISTRHLLSLEMISLAVIVTISCPESAEKLSVVYISQPTKSDTQIDERRAAFRLTPGLLRRQDKWESIDIDWVVGTYTYV